MELIESSETHNCNIFQNFIMQCKDKTLPGSENFTTPWIIDANTNEVLTLNTALKEIKRLRKVLVEEGIKRGDAVAFLMENNILIMVCNG